MHLELIAKLLNTEYQFRKRARRVGIYDALENCFRTSSRSQDDAIKNAHFKRDLRDAVSEGNVEKVKQLTLGDVATSEVNVPVVADKSKNWKDMKFKNKD